MRSLKTIREDLRQWFDPNHPKGGWKRINSKGEAIGPCAREPGEPKPKCMSNQKRASLSKKERAAAVRAKRKHDPVADRSGKGGKPVNVSNFGKGKLSENMDQIDEKNKPTNPKLWSRAVSLARSKFDVYPSAYANGWAAKWYKSKGGGWKSISEETIEEGRPSQRHPLEGHEYHKKTDAALEYIAKDAHKAAEAMKGHNTDAENKYRDQANDSATVRYWRKQHGMPDWYKKKYGHIKEGAVPAAEKTVTLQHKTSGKKIRVVHTAADTYKKLGYEQVKEAYGPLVSGASPRSTSSRQSPKPQEKPKEPVQQAQPPKPQQKPASATKPTGSVSSGMDRAKGLAQGAMQKQNLSSGMDRARGLARLGMAKQIAKQKNEQYIVPTGFSEQKCTCEEKGKDSCRMHGEQWNVGMGESTEPSYKLRAARQHYAKVYMSNAKTIHQSKDAKDKAYASVKAKYGDKIHDELKAHHEKNMKEEVEMLDENPAIAAIGATAGRALASAAGRKLGSTVARSMASGAGKQAVKRVGAILRTPKARETAGKVGAHLATSLADKVRSKFAEFKKKKKVQKEDVEQEGAIVYRPAGTPEEIKKYLDARKKVPHADTLKKKPEEVKKEEVEYVEEGTPAWQRKEGQSETGGLNRKGIAAYRRANPGSKLSMAVTTKPSKLKPGSKAANRRKSFCARMGGMKKRLTSAETARDPDSRINKALRKWNC